MGIAASPGPTSAFRDLGFKRTIDALLAEVCDLYLSDSSPWVVGYSGGKDSTATMALVWLALERLQARGANAEHRKPVYVISTDTLVENPIVAAWVGESLEAMRSSAERTGLPILPHRLTPAVSDTFWVNLVGKGYAAPRPKFRWCTDRLKIKPCHAFIDDVARRDGEAVLVLGTRKAESRARARSMGKLEERRGREKLGPNASRPGSLVYTPIETWSNDDVWTFLLQVENPWGHDNEDLLAMYRGASDDGECPLVVDTSTPSCGDTRFGCWVCTMVDEDRSMQAMIRSDEDHEWLLPLLQLRNELDADDDRDQRDFRRMTGRLHIHEGRLVHGPYHQRAREKWLRRLLEVERSVREHAPAHARDLVLITLEELIEIRRIWVVEKHEVEDNLPRIYAEVTGQPFPGPPFEESAILGPEDLTLLREACDGDEIHLQLARELLDLEQRHHAPWRSRRHVGLHDALEQALRRHAYASEQDAERFALQEQQVSTSMERARRDRETG